MAVRTGTVECVYVRHPPALEGLAVSAEHGQGSVKVKGDYEEGGSTETGLLDTGRSSG